VKSGEERGKVSLSANIKKGGRMERGEKKSSSFGHLLERGKKRRKKGRK